MYCTHVPVHVTRVPTCAGIRITHVRTISDCTCMKVTRVRKITTAPVFKTTRVCTVSDRTRLRVTRAYNCTCSRVSHCTCTFRQRYTSLINFSCTLCCTYSCILLAIMPNKACCRKGDMLYARVCNDVCTCSVIQNMYGIPNKPTYNVAEICADGSART